MSEHLEHELANQAILQEEISDRLKKLEREHRGGPDQSLIYEILDRQAEQINQLFGLVEQLALGTD